MKNIIFRESCKDDRKSILDLINLVQPHLPWSKEYFEWQYLDNPAGKAKIWVAEHNGNIVSNYVAVPHLFKVDQREGIAWMIQDILTHPDYRKRGIMHKLHDLCSEAICNEQFPINYTFPDENRGTYRLFLKNGWQNLFRIPLRFVTDLNSKLTNSREHLKSTVACSSFNEDIDELWNKSKRDFVFAISRGSSYLTWRYLKRPQAQYFPYIAKQEGLVKGLIIMKYYDTADDVRVAHICDLFTEPGNDPIVRKLLVRAHTFAVEFNATKLTVWNPIGHPYEPIYDKMGFILDQSVKHWLVVKTEDDLPGTIESDKSENWHLSMGDSDVY